MICPTCAHDNLPGNEQCAKCQHSLSQYDIPTPGTHVERCLMEDRVASLPPKPPTTVLPTATVREAIGLMLQHNVGALLVVDAAGQLAGIFSERDLLKRVAGIHDDYADLPVSQFMTHRPEAVSPSDTLIFVLHKMDGRGYRHVPVIDAGRPVSVLSVRDMLRHITRLCREGKEN